MAGHLPVSPVYLALFHVKLCIKTWMRVFQVYRSFPVHLRGSGITVTLVTIVITYPSVVRYVLYPLGIEAVTWDHARCLAT